MTVAVLKLPPALSPTSATCSAVEPMTTTHSKLALTRKLCVLAATYLAYTQFKCYLASAHSSTPNNRRKILLPSDEEMVPREPVNSQWTIQVHQYPWPIVEGKSAREDNKHLQYQLSDTIE